jgi:hypothetical protein
MEVISKTKLTVQAANPKSGFIRATILKKARLTIK